MLSVRKNVISGFTPIKSGFTLIELLVVIAVVGVLAGAVVVMVNPALQMARARNAQRKSDLRQIASALDRYVTVNGSYPITGAGYCDTANTGWGVCNPNPLQKLVDSGDLKKLPIDPRDNQLFFPCDDTVQVGYLYISNGTDYKLLAHCGPEGNVYSSTDPFFDSARPTWAWQISTPGANALGW